MPAQHRLHARCACAFEGAASRDGTSETLSWRAWRGLHEEEGLAEARPFAFHTSPRQFERDRPFLVQHLALDLALDIAKKQVSGTATLALTRVDPDADTVTLDAIGFDIASVTVDGSEVAHTYDGRTISVPLARKLATAKVSVTYKATPRRGLYFLEPDEHVPDRPRQVWSQCQEEDARHWLPCHDKPHVKMTTEITVRVPNGWFALSNGELAHKELPSAPGPWSFHYKMTEPHPSYLLTLVAGEFAELKAAAGKVPLAYLVPRGREADGDRTFKRTPDMVQYFGEVTGVPYPWSRYTQVVVHDFIFGGMENTTATTMYEHILLDPRAAIDVSSDDLISHELAHQWFGDYVTCRDWSEAWLNEGFATYMEHVWREKHLGRDEYDYGVKGDLDSYLAEAHGRYRRPIVCQDYDAPLDLFDRHLYEKSALVLHALRTELGPKLFWKGIQKYLTRHARSVVETRDLMRALEEVSGRSLGRFFEQWVYKPGHPEVEVSIAWEKEVLTVVVKQHQAATDGVPATFEFPMHLDISDARGVRRERLAVTQKTEAFAIPCLMRPAYVVVDPEMRILGDVKLKMPNDMLRLQLEKAPYARARWLAAHALGQSDDPPTIQALAARLMDEEEFWGVRAQSADALGTIRAKECFEVLARAATVKHPKARRAVMEALGKFRSTAAAEALRPRALKDESFLVESEAARSLGKTKQPAAFDTLLDVLDRPSWADVLSAGAIDGLAALRDDRAIPHVLARTRYGHPSRTRRAAVMALPKLAVDRKAREALEDLLEDVDPMLRLDVARALGELADAKARPALRARLEVDLDARVKRRIRETLRDLGPHGGARATDHLKEELEKLQTEHQELKARMGALEARSVDPKKVNGVATKPSEAKKKAPAKKEKAT